MQKLLAALIVFILPSVISAQENYLIAATQSQVIRVNRARSLVNRVACTKVGLPITCTQADVNILVPPPEPMPIIYPDSVEGRAAFLRTQLVQDLLNMEVEVTTRETTDFCDWFRMYAGTNQKNAICAAAGLPVGCDVCRQR